MQPLSGVTILDLTRLLPGGLCTLILADLGADVLKIEEPGRGDYLRASPPLGKTQSALFTALNRGKRSMTLNLKREEGRALLLELARRADVLVESYRPGVLPLFAPRGGGRPIVPGVQLADIGGGAFPAALGITAALLERERTGRGQV